MTLGLQKTFGRKYHICIERHHGRYPEVSTLWRMPGSPEGKLVVTTMTSGTTGLGQEVYGFTKADIEKKMSDSYHTYTWAGINPGDMFAVFLPVGVTSAGQLLSRSLIEYGAHTMMWAALNPKTRIEYMERFQPQCLFATPSYLTYLNTEIHKAGLDPKKIFQLKL